MFKFKPSLLQILFTLSFLRCVFLSVSPRDFFHGYLLFEWLWVSFIANQSSRHTLAHPRTIQWSRRSMRITLFFAALFALIYVVSLLMMFPYVFTFIVYPSPLYVFTFNMLKIVCGLVFLLNLVILYLNLKRILPNKPLLLSFFQVMIYPWGVFTIQSQLKSSSTRQHITNSSPS